jgi:hypothetical protein
VTTKRNDGGDVGLALGPASAGRGPAQGNGPGPTNS